MVLYSRKGKSGKEKYPHSNLKQLAITLAAKIGLASFILLALTATTVINLTSINHNNESNNISAGGCQKRRVTGYVFFISFFNKS